MLKASCSGADEYRMFLRCRESVLLTEEGIDALCPSLNRPVVDIQDLPAGPAQAAIALDRSESGERRLIVAVRSEISGEVALFAFRGELNSQPTQAMDPGLQFAEGMGFLFDEDVLAGNLPGAERKALETWCQLTGDELPRQRPASDRHGTRASANPADEVLLVDALSSGGDDPSPHLLRPGARAEGAVLSKFRRPEQVRSVVIEPPEDAGGAPAQLGRIPIVQRRSNAGQPAGTQVPGLLARLLARF
jgi:hypothetical protein